MWASSMYTFNILAPVFLLVFLGWLLRRTGFITQDFTRGMTKLTFYVALPCLLFVKIAPPPEAGSQAAAGRITLVLLGVMLACVVASYLSCLILSVKGRTVGAVVQASFRGNLAYVGLPVVLYALEGANTANVDGWGRTAVLALAPIIPSYNILSVVVLLAGREAWSIASVRRVVWRSLTNPLVVACAVGAVFSYGHLTAPSFAFRAATSLGHMGLPLALLSLGASLSRAGMAKRGSTALLAALLKVGVAPLAAWLLAGALSLGPEETRIALIFASCPAAVMSFVMAAQYDSDEETAAGAVMISTLLSPIALTLVIALT